jgi:hypothetical protein
MSTAHPSDSRKQGNPMESGRRSKDSDSTVALVREKLKMMADEPTYHGIVCGKALALIERQQRELEELTESEDAYSDENAYLKRELEARDARIAVLVGALRPFTQHFVTCALRQPATLESLQQPRPVCDCGLTAALQGNSGKGEGK